MKRIATVFVVLLVLVAFTIPAMAKPPKSVNVKSKFYDFSDQLIDGEIRKPTALYTDVRQKVKFERLLKLKKSFMRSMFQTSKERVFK
jgi:hypothetical protein